MKWVTSFGMGAAALVSIAPLAKAEDARVLPAGRSRFSLIYGHTAGISQTFNNDGKVESVTAPYNVDLSSSTLRGFDPQISQLIDVLNNTKLHYDISQHDSASHGITTDDSKPLLGDALTRGFLGVDAEAKREQYNLAFQHGVTDRLTLGFMVPYIKTTVNVDHAMTGINTANDIYQGFASGNPGALGKLSSSLDFLRSANDETFQNILVDKGYDRFGNYTGNGIGDLVFGGRYKYLDNKFKSGEYIASVQLGATVPTGHIRPPRELTAVDFGQGAWDIGAANIVNYTPFRLLTLSQSFHYTYRLASTRLMRVRADASDAIPDASDEENVHVNLGDKYWTNIGAKLSPSKAFSIEASYEWFWKRQDKFSGSRPRDYTYMSDATDAYTETFQIGASISSIPAFMKFDFPVPCDLSVNYFWPLNGKNSVIAPYGTAELALYF